MAATGQVLMLASGKGGVGKTSLTVLLGLALARRGCRVLALELDAGLRGMDLLLGLADGAVFDLADVMAGRCPPSGAITAVPEERNLHLIQAPALADAPWDSERFRHCIQGFRRVYDFILIDVPAGFRTAFSEAAAVAGLALVVATPDPVSARDARAASDRLDACGLTAQRLVINRVPTRGLTRSLAVPDLDHIIDAAAIQLLGALPEAPEEALRLTRGEAIALAGRLPDAVGRIAGRLLGQKIPLAL